MSRRLGGRPLGALLAVLVLASLLTVAPTPHAGAQDDGLPTVEVPADWALVPAGVSAGESFRLLFVTSTKRNATSTDIADYNSFVQARAAASSDATIVANSAHFRVLGSTADVDARDNTESNVNVHGAGEKIFWLGGPQAADDYADLYDGAWDSNGYRDENGASVNSGGKVFTGSNDSGTKQAANAFGKNFVYHTINPQTNGLHYGAHGRSASERFFGLSPVFEVAASSGTLPEVSIMAGTSPVTEGAAATFTVSASPQPSAALTVSVNVTESGSFIPAHLSRERYRHR